MASAKDVLPVLRHDLASTVAVTAVGQPAVDLALHLRKSISQMRGTKSSFVGRTSATSSSKVERSLGSEVCRPADAERGVENDASHDVTDRHEAQGDRGRLAVRIPGRCEPSPPANWPSGGRCTSRPSESQSSRRCRSAGVARRRHRVRYQVPRNAQAPPR